MGSKIENEFSPNLHKSHNWTIERTNARQNKNYLNSITGTLLGNTNSISYSGMVNYIFKTPSIIKCNTFFSGYFHKKGNLPQENHKVVHFKFVGFGPKKIDAHTSNITIGQQSNSLYKQALTL